MRLTLIFLVLAAVVVQDALSLRIRPSPSPKQKNVDVSKLCALKKCGKGKSCRVVKSTTGYRRKRDRYLALCLPCVPKGADDMCNALGFARALLIPDKCSGVQVKTIRKLNRRGRKGKKNRGKGANKKNRRHNRYRERKIYIVDERQVEPQYCHLSSGKGKVGCPNGAKCVSYARYDFSGIGVCCYGPGKVPRQAVKNDDKVCGLCKKECGKRESCQEDVSKSGRKKYTCQPRQYPGCPRTPYDCKRMTEAKAKACEDKNDCGSTMACCPTSCSVDSFVCAHILLY